MSDKVGKHLFESQGKKNFRACSSLVHGAAQTVPTFTRMLKSLSRDGECCTTLEKETLKIQCVGVVRENCVSEKSQFCRT